jgi:hypothetical protein
MYECLKGSPVRLTQGLPRRQTDSTYVCGSMVGLGYARSLPFSLFMVKRSFMSG